MIKDFIPVFRPYYTNDEIKAVNKVLKSGWIGLGPTVAEFEKRFATYVGARHAVALNSATSALHLALIVSNIQKGDEVIVPALTFVSTAHVVLYVGAKPVFADIDPDTLCISPKDVARKITKNTRAIIPVHYGGHPANMRELQRLARKYKLTIIEDAAHACGSVYRKHKVGSISPLTCFSFHAVKNLATGDGGMITTNSNSVAERLHRLRWLGINKPTWDRIERVSGPSEKVHKIYGWYYEIDELGYKYHMNDISAALGLVQLGKLEKANKKRRKLADIYTKNLSSLSEIQCPVVHPHVVTSQHNYAIRCNQRDELHIYLREHGISTGVHYLPLHLQPFYRKRYPEVSLPATEREWQKILLLPLYPQMTAKDQSYIIDKVHEFFAKPALMNTKSKKDYLIPGKKVKLRTVQREDIELLRRWRNKNRHFFFDTSIISKRQQTKWFQEYKKRNDDLLFVIETLKGKPIGTVSLYHIDPKAKRAEYGRMIIGNKTYRSKGYAKNAMLSVIKFAFSTLGLDEITLEVLKNNSRAIGLYKNVGFRELKKGPTHPEITTMVLKKTTYTKTESS